MKRDNPGLPRPPRQPVFPATLTIDETTAHVTAPPGLSDALFLRMRQSGISCRLLRAQGIRGLDVIDFGNPPASQEQQIRAIFHEFAACKDHAEDRETAPGRRADQR
jgi:hypothetical protein